MFKQAEEVVVGFEDWRGRLLIGLALLLIAVGHQKFQGSTTETTSKALEMKEAWVEMDLRWEPQGRLGQGIYVDSGKDTRLSDAEERRLGEPRLAVFTYRPLDLNRIDFDGLRVLKGVGPKLATAIIGYRQNHGPFGRIEDLLEVKGVGPAKFKELSRSLVVSGG
jgi:competence ComEA-like helix-hairpin-helix protein